MCKLFFLTKKKSSCDHLTEGINVSWIPGNNCTSTLLWGFFFPFFVGEKKSTQLQCSVGNHISLQKKSSLCISLLADFSLCESSLCCEVNFLPVLDQIPVYLLRLLQICCEWSCQQVGLYKLGLILQQPRVLGVDCLPSSLVILNRFFFFTFRSKYQYD